MAAAQTLEIISPDDWHIHLRDGSLLELTVPLVSQHFHRAIVMPNLKPAVTTTQLAEEYRKRIVKQIPPGRHLEPLMTCYLTDNTEPDDLLKGHKAKILFAAKLYPKGATTHAEAGVSDWRKIKPVLDAMQSHSIPLLIHGEVTDPNIDIFDREQVYIERELTPLLKQFPKLKVVLEHITTEQAVNFVRKNSPQLAATITPHHLMINRSDLFYQGIRPHLYCLPIAKREHHRQALRLAATSGDDCFFLGTDSAPHSLKDKEAACGCAGIFNSESALAVYAQVFEEHEALHKLEKFSSVNGPNFYGLPINKDKTILSKTPWKLEKIYKNSGQEFLPYPDQATLSWQASVLGPRP